MPRREPSSWNWNLIKAVDIPSDFQDDGLHRDLQSPKIRGRSCHARDSNKTSRFTGSLSRSELFSAALCSLTCVGFHGERLSLGNGHSHCSLEAAPTAGSGQDKPLVQIQALVLQQDKPSLRGRAAVGTAWFTVPEPSLSQLMDMETTTAFRERDLSTWEGKGGGRGSFISCWKTSLEQEGARAQCRASCSEWRGGTEAQDQRMLV